MMIARRILSLTALLLLCRSSYSEIFQSLAIRYPVGTHFLPVNPIESLATITNVKSFQACFRHCHENLLCRTFVSDSSSPFSCLLYESSIDTGSIQQSISVTSAVGALQYLDLYKFYGKSCPPNTQNFDRYLVCRAGIWRCPQNTYWNGSVCLNAGYHQYPCLQDDYCRQDIGLKCRVASNKCECNFTGLWNGTYCDTCNTIREQCNTSISSNASICCAGLTCIPLNASYSQCQLITISTTISTTTTTSTMSTTSLTTTTTTTTTTTSLQPISNITRNGTSHRYYDCAKPSCAWPGKAKVYHPVLSCDKDGITTVDNNTASVIDNGTAFTCTNQQPWNVSNTLSYGFASANLDGHNESAWCCACYQLTFKSAPITGKQMIVQVISTNTGSNNVFGISIPGSGWGGIVNGCEIQFNLTSVWGNQYGGIVNRTQCNALPSVLQPGCLWRFDWFMGASNPDFSFIEVPCPINLTSITKCNRV